MVAMPEETVSQTPEPEKQETEMEESAKKKLLIVEDEQAILRGLEDLFTFNGFDVHSRSDGQEGLDAALNQKFDCIILDVMLPSLDGFTICDRIRKQSREQPILMLTAKNSEEDIINGLALGADDYMSKPFSVRELVLRVQALLRRTTPSHSDDKLLQINNGTQINTYDLSAKIGGKKVLFTRREVDILQLLKKHVDRPVSRDALLSEVWGYKNCDHLDTRTVDIHMAKLRKKIEKDPKHPSSIITIRGEGYLLRGNNPD